ncbi:hypothetical protein HU830_02005 [Lactobacillus sp. DCY120]|uniref:Uncharacterized protein n=1 Tax=Bombilactobacillus apium TaxID=2675299 RepID=A0A850R991_9LACO|nr:hypothetical protein [Bombilactobacillus apium]NVY95966.1 hypothetical protein [Bombilactobacillus apium]
MNFQAINKKIRVQYLSILGLAIFISVWCIFSSPNNYDIVKMLIRSNFPVLFSQIILLSLMSWQILTFKSVAIMVGVRQKTEYVQKQLLFIVLLETSIYFGVYYVSFFLTGRKAFIDGSFVIGILILLLRFSFMIILAIIIAGIYQFSYPGVLIIFSILANLGYHYIFEMQYLLIQYSKIYDPVYRALHHIHMS